MFGRQRVKHNPGKFRHSLTLTPPNGSQSTSGDYQFSWGSSPLQTIAVRGCWRQTSQREAVMDGSKYSAASGVWEIPWVSGVSTLWRVEFGARKYRIVGIENLDERNRELHLYVVEDEGAESA